MRQGDAAHPRLRHVLAAAEYRRRESLHVVTIALEVPLELRESEVVRFQSKEVQESPIAGEERP